MTTRSSLPAPRARSSKGSTVRLHAVCFDESPLDRELVVNLLRVRHRDHGAAVFQRHHVGLIVITPVPDVSDTVRGQMIQCVPRLLQARAQPSCRMLAGVLLDGGEYAFDDLLFLARGGFVESAGVTFVMSHPFPLTLLSLLYDFRMLSTNVAVQGHRRPHVISVEHIHDPEHPHTIAIVPL